MWSAIWFPDLLLSEKTESSLLSIRLNLLAAMSDTLLWVCMDSSWSRHQSNSSRVSTARRTLVPSSKNNRIIPEKYSQVCSFMCSFKHPNILFSKCLHYVDFTLKIQDHSHNSHLTSSWMELREQFFYSRGSFRYIILHHILRDKMLIR